jgi:hypothetical protein
MHEHAEKPTERKAATDAPEDAPRTDAKEKPAANSKK